MATHICINLQNRGKEASKNGSEGFFLQIACNTVKLSAYLESMMALYSNTPKCHTEQAAVLNPLRP